MKRVLVILILLVAVLFGILYFGISSTQSFSKSVLVACTNEGAMRVLVTERAVKQGWPGEKLNDSTYNFNGLQYTVGASLINVTALRFNNVAYGELIVDETMPDSCRFTINYAQQLPVNPLNRIKTYFGLQKTKETVDAMLAALQKNFIGEELVYGINISMSRVTDSVMISTRKLMNRQPTIAEVYEMIDAIRTYIKSNGGEETSAPMLNVFEEGANQYLVMVAVPVKTVIKGNETFLLKMMLPNGFILVSEVVGGDDVIKKGEVALRQFVIDHQKSSPAIPFQMLVTDRRAEPDTTKWKTKLYYPVMY